MTESERQQILKMIDDGKISAEQGLVLMRALEEAANEEPELEEAGSDVDVVVEEPQSQAGQSGVEASSSPDFERKLKKFRNLWIIPLVAGVILTIGGAYMMYAAMQAGGLGFWFFFAWLPFMIGVLLTALGFSSRTSRWIYLNIRQKPGESPQRIAFGFPLSLVSWGVGLAGNFIPEKEDFAVSEVMKALTGSALTSEPLMVDVHDDDGTHVQVYIG
jgi:hypothetical protein